jgi:hypothetical protein
MYRLAAAARAARADEPDAEPVQTLLVPGGQHSWLYEDEHYRHAVAEFLTRSLGGPLDPGAAGELAASTAALRLPDAEIQFVAVTATKGGLRTLAEVALPGATRPPRDRDGAAAPGPASSPAAPAGEP